MNNFMDALLNKVAALTERTNLVADAADKVLGNIVPAQNAEAAFCYGWVYYACWCWVWPRYRRYYRRLCWNWRWYYQYTCSTNRC